MSKSNSTLTSDQLRELLHYDSLTGVFTWLKSRSRLAKANTTAGTLNKKGYIKIIISGKSYAAHRLAWFYEYGSFPEKQIDHIDGDRKNNRITNLREAGPADNSRNSKIFTSHSTGFKGVLKRGSKRWQARIMIFNKSTYLGSFGSPESAHAAYCEAAKAAFGEFFNPG